MSNKTTIRKSTIKQIVKECLIEILSEGIGAEGYRLNESKNKSDLMKKTSSLPPKQKTLSKEAKKIRSEFINEITGGGIMAEMMNETLESGRAQEFATNSENKSCAVGAVEQAIENKDPNEIFGDETVNQWAALAFQGMHIPDDE